MPKLIIDRPKGKRTPPPCGRVINYVEASSPFQKLIDGERIKRGLSVRALAAEIGASPSNMWIWLHNENGYPHPKSFKPSHLKGLSRALGLTVEEIEGAIDASRHIYTPQEEATPHAMIDGFLNFIQILENDRRETLKKSYVLNLARTIYNGNALSSAKKTGSSGESVGDFRQKLARCAG